MHIERKKNDGTPFFSQRTVPEGSKTKEKKFPATQRIKHSLISQSDPFHPPERQSDKKTICAVQATIVRDHEISIPTVLAAYSQLPIALTDQRQTPSL